MCVCVLEWGGGGGVVNEGSLKRNQVAVFSPMYPQHRENTSIDSWKCSKILDSAKEINGQLCYRKLIIFIAFAPPWCTSRGSDLTEEYSAVQTYRPHSRRTRHMAGSPEH